LFYFVLVGFSMYFGWDNFSTVSFVYVPVLVRVSVFFLHLNTCMYYKKVRIGVW